MKKTLIALAVMASCSAFAQVSATSSVSGFVQSSSAASGNQVSTQAANASSTNYAGGFRAIETLFNAARSISQAETSGFTHAGAVAGGTGPGASLSQAVQAGNATAENASINRFGTLLNNAGAQVGTASQAAVGSAPGSATGTSFAVARNISNGLMSTNIDTPARTNINGATAGSTIMNMAVPSSGSGAAFSFGTLGGGTGAIQNGGYSGTITSP